MRLTGHVSPQSEVYALNQRSNLIFGEYTVSGDYDFTMEAAEKDRVSLWYVTGSIESPPNDFEIRLPPQPAQ